MEKFIPGFLITAVLLGQTACGEKMTERTAGRNN